MPLWTSRQNSNPPTDSNATALGHPSPQASAPSLGRNPPDARPSLRPAGSPYTSSPGISSSPFSFGGSPPKSRSHGRSKSQTLPSLFGVGKKKDIIIDSDGEVNLGVSPEAYPRSNPFSTGTSGKARPMDKDLTSYTCATCAGAIRQSKGLTQFRCTACSMVNDLKPSQTITPVNNGTGSSASVVPLSIERTRAIIKSCIGEFWEQRLKLGYVSPPNKQTPSSDTQSRLRSSKPGQLSPIRSPRENAALPSPTTLSHRKPVHPANLLQSVPIRPRPVATPPSPHNGENSIRPGEDTTENEELDSTNKRIFKPLEEYFIQSFKGVDCINLSFCLLRPAPRAGRDIDRFPVSTALKPRTDNPKEETNLSELDAKTLLLGDVAENGMWWTGRDDRAIPKQRATVRPQRSSDRLKGDVNPRIPNINWAEVDRWYEAVVRVGENWREILREIHRSNGTEFTIEENEALEIDRAMADGRLHTQRMLLKASESLLKRPGRPLVNLEDCRFLLILLANPTMRFRPLRVENVQNTHLASAHGNDHLGKGPSESLLARSRAGGSPEHFVVLRRILGLLSNISSEQQRHIAYWLARYDEKAFRNLVELLQSFLTYRLSRQRPEGRMRSNSGNPTTHLIPEYQASGGSAQLHAALGLSSQPKTAADGRQKLPPYSDDWQTKATAKVLAIVFAANRMFQGSRDRLGFVNVMPSSTHTARRRGPLLPNSEFYNTMVEFADLVSDFEAWEKKVAEFTFCQYPFLLSVGAKIRILEYDARRQMESKAREAFFNSILRNKNTEQFLILKVRRDCLVEDSLKSISQVVGAGQEEMKKGLKVQFVNEEGIDAGGLRKEWFLLLVREIFDPNHGMFVYDEDSRLCYFNPHSFETTDQYYLVGALLGLAIYNSTILDVALPPFVFKKLLMSSSTTRDGTQSSFARFNNQYTLDDLAEFRPALADGLRRLLAFDGNVEETFCRDFVVTEERYGQTEQIPLGPNGAARPVTNANRQEFVDLYIRYELDTRVARQFEPFKRGFMTVCGGNALSLFQPEEIEQLIRGSDEALDVNALKGVAVYENFRRADKDILEPAENVALLRWFWDFFAAADPKMQRRLLSFITGSDRIPAVGATSLVIRIVFGGMESNRFPVARTCFNSLRLYGYSSRRELEERLTRAVVDSEGFGLK